MMDTKKNEARFTIKFNPVNPRHREAMRILNETGRGKAALIADALCMYAHYGTDLGADLLGRGTKEIATDIQNVESFKDSKADRANDDALLEVLVDSAELFFN